MKKLVTGQLVSKPTHKLPKHSSDHIDCLINMIRGVVSMRITGIQFAESTEESINPCSSDVKGRWYIKFMYKPYPLTVPDKQFSRQEAADYLREINSLLDNEIILMLDDEEMR